MTRATADGVKEVIMNSLASVIVAGETSITAVEGCITKEELVVVARDNDGVEKFFSVTVAEVENPETTGSRNVQQPQGECCDGQQTQEESGGCCSNQPQEVKTQEEVSAPRKG